MRLNLRNALISGGVAIALAFAFMAVTPGKANAEDSVQRLISVTGEASVNVAPDMATVSLGVETTASTAQEAQRENSSKMSAVVTALKDAGIASDDIQTSNFSLHPVYESHYEKTGVGSDPKTVLTGYRCNNTVTAKVKVIARIGAVIDQAISAGATNVNGISFNIENPEQYKNEVLASAVRNARSKADVMAGAAGVTITGIKTISDGYSLVMPERGEALGYGMKADVSTVIEPGTVTVTGSVRIDFTF